MTVWEKIFATEFTNERIIHRTARKLLQVNKQGQNTQFKNERKVQVIHRLQGQIMANKYLSNDLLLAGNENKCKGGYTPRLSGLGGRACPFLIKILMRGPNDAQPVT